jgi:hypothetical protein
MKKEREEEKKEFEATKKKFEATSKKLESMKKARETKKRELETEKTSIKTRNNGLQRVCYGVPRGLQTPCRPLSKVNEADAADHNVEKRVNTGRTLILPQGILALSNCRPLTGVGELYLWPDETCQTRFFGWASIGSRSDAGRFHNLHIADELVGPWVGGW